MAPVVTLTEVPAPAQGDLFEWAATRPAKPPPVWEQLGLFGESEGARRE